MTGEAGPVPGTRRVGGRYVTTTPDGKRPVYRRGPVRFKSRYEFNYSLFLDFIGIAWVYERRKFIFHRIQSGVRVYIPDFYLPQASQAAGHEIYHECKGYLDRKSRTKLTRLQRYYPEVELVLIDAAFFRSVERQRLCRVIPGWICPHQR